MANPETEDLTHYCRVCMQQPGPGQTLDLTAIYDEDERLTYSECFTVCTGIQLDGSQANEPCSLCNSCGLELQMAYNFYKKVEESKKLLHYLIQEKESKVQRSKNLLDSIGVQYEQLQLIEADALSFPEDVLVKPPESSSLDTLAGADDAAKCIKISNSAPTDLGSSKIEIVAIEDCNIDEELVELDEQFNNCDYQSDGYEAIEEMDEDEVCADIDEFGSAPNEEEQDANVLFLVDKRDTSDEETNAIANFTKSSLEATINLYLPPVSRQPSGSYQCSYCDKVFTLYSRMRAHRRIHEKNRPKYDCSFCGRVYVSKQALRVHQLQTHAETDTGDSNSNAFSSACTVCGKKFAIAKLLEVHMRFHTGDFPFGCDLCDKKFAQRSHLATHKSVKHNSSRFICSFPNCGRLFTSSSSLRNHEYTHSGMPFECSYCRQGYPAKSKLKVHLRIKHGVDFTLEQMEQMRKFQRTRSKPYLVKLAPADN